MQTLHVYTEVVLGVMNGNGTRC